MDAASASSRDGEGGSATITVIVAAGSIRTPTMSMSRSNLRLDAPGHRIAPTLPAEWTPWEASNIAGRERETGAICRIAPSQGLRAGTAITLGGETSVIIVPNARTGRRVR